MSTPIYDELKPLSDAYPVARANNVWFSSGNGTVEDAIVYGSADQLIPYPYDNASGSTSQGATYTYTSDAKITINRSSATSSTAQFFPYVGTDMELVEGHKYTLSIEVISGTGKAGVYIANRLNSSSSVSVLGRNEAISAGTKKSVTFTYSKNADYKDDIVSVFVDADVTCSNLKVRVMLESGGASHEFSPYNLSRASLRADIEALKTQIGG